MERRLILKLLAAGFWAGNQPSGLVSILSASPDYTPHFFTPHEFETVDRLADIILPADDHSPGSHEALVHRYIDVVVSETGEKTKAAWREGLQALDGEAETRFQKSFLNCSERQQQEIVGKMAAGEASPQTPLERFFTRIKQATIDGYYTSKVGLHDELKYAGNTALSEFPGCTHGGHETG